MKYLFGSQNFGIDIPGSDKDYAQFYYPELSDLCRPIPQTKNENHEDGSLTKYIDVRAIPGLFYKSNLDILQLLYSKEVIDGGVLEVYFRKYEHELSTINIPRLYQSVMGAALNRFKKGTTKDLAHIIFSFRLLEQFEKQGFKDLRKCFEHNQREYYQAIRNGDYDTWFSFAKKFEEQMLEKKESYMAQKPNDEFKAKMDRDFGMMVLNHLA